MSRTVPPPARRNLRPTTAGARLQTHPSFSTGIDGNRPATGKISISRPKTHVGGQRKSTYDRDNSSSDREKQPRRLTVGPGGITENDLIKNNGAHVPISELLRDKVRSFIQFFSYASFHYLYSYAYFPNVIARKSLYRS